MPSCVRNVPSALATGTPRSRRTAKRPCRSATGTSAAKQNLEAVGSMPTVRFTTAPLSEKTSWGEELCTSNCVGDVPPCINMSCGAVAGTQPGGSPGCCGCCVVASVICGCAWRPRAPAPCCCCCAINCAIKLPSLTKGVAGAAIPHARSRHGAPVTSFLPVICRQI